MLTERLWLEIPAQLLTSNGGKYGQISVPSTREFKVKQKVRLFSNTQPIQDLEIKRVISQTDIILGPVGPEMKATSDLTLFLTAHNAALMIPEQNRNPIVPDAFWRAVYDEEPTIAIRTIAVDAYGNKYGPGNPLPIAFDGTIAVGNVTIQDDDGDELAINPDGSLNVVVQTTAGETVISEYNEVSSVATGANTDIVTYTAPPGVVTYLSKIDFSGDNIAKFSVDLNGTVIDKQRTYFGGDLNGTFNYANGSRGLLLSPGDVVTLKVIHARPSAGDFNGRIQLVES